MIKILYVDDNPDEREFYKVRLTRHSEDIELIEAEDAVEALEILKQECIDCIISDYQMPKVNGLQFLKILRESGIEIPFIFLTGQGSEDIAAKALRAGADDYFTKDEGFAHYQRLHNSIRRVVDAHNVKLKHEEAMNALDESEKNYLYLIKGATDPVIIVQDGLVKRVNPQLSLLSGFSLEEILGKPFADFVLPADLPKVMSFYDRRMGGDDSRFTYETSIIKKDGGRLEVEASTTSITLNGKRAILVFMRDITERKQNEEMIRESERVYRALFEQANDAVFRLGLDGSYLDANQKAADMLGCTREELIGMSFRDFVVAEEHSDSERRLRALLAGEELPVYGRVFRKKSGERIGVEMNVALVRDNEGNPKFLQSIIRDVTERKRAEAAIRESEEKFRSIVEHAHDGIFIVDLEGKIIFANAQVLRLLKANSVDDILGVNAYSFVADKTLVNAKAGLEAVVRDGVAKDVELTVLRQDGTEIQVELTGSLIRDTLGNPISVLAMARDISERKRYEEDLERSFDQLAAMNKELEAFSFSVSHDLKAPLRHIKGFSEIIDYEYSDKLDEFGREAIKAVSNSAAKMQKIIDSLMQLSRSTNVELNRSEVDLSAMVSELFEEKRHINPDRSADIVVEPGLVAKCDANLMKVALENLVGNAWKYTGKQTQPSIEFGISKRNGHNTYFIKDNGVGFDPAKADNLFMPFQRLATDSEFEGTGIGLSTVQRIIHKHSGLIWAEGKPGEGATFYFTLSE